MNEGIAHSGAWFLAAIMVVIASWIFYRYFARKTWIPQATGGYLLKIF